MVMIFQSEKPRQHLLEKGFVLTFRKLHMSGRKLGKDWITDKRCGKKIADVLVFSEYATVKPTREMLAPYVNYSGFDSVDEWIEEIERLNRPDTLICLTGEIFCVVLRHKEVD